MKLSNNRTASSQKAVKVIKNAHSVAEQRAIGDRWADYEGHRMTLAETLAHAAQLDMENEKKKQLM